MGRQDRESDSLDERPRHFKRAVKPRHKKYGIEQWSTWFKKWCHRQWYVTEKARDQALEDLKRHTCNILKEHGKEPQYRKINR
jgi:hypothetical protein